VETLNIRAIFVGAGCGGKALDPAALRFEEFVIEVTPQRIVLLGRDDPRVVPFTTSFADYHRGEAGTLLAVHTFRPIKQCLGQPNGLAQVFLATDSARLR
jgi:hypothetical protein